MSRTNSGIVYLVGAGPGDPELLTVKAQRLIGEADVLLHDSLIRAELVEEVPPASTEVIHVGKRPDDDGRRWAQSEINRLMARRATRGQTVVRLKGGDPTMFGRGGEEAQYLASEDIPFEFVPGISSTVAAPEVVGIPLTHREYCSNLTVITGHEDPSKPESALDWEVLAESIEMGGTLVILMGVGRLEENTTALRENGVPGETPTAMIEQATWPDGKMIRGTLDSIVDDCEAAGITPPAVTVVGDVVAVYEDLAEHVNSGLTGTDWETQRSTEPWPNHPAVAPPPILDRIEE